MKFLRFLILITALLIYSCNSESPIASETGFGNVTIQSNVDSCEIIVDDVITGLITPATLELSAVKHLLKLRKSGFFSEEREVSILKDKTITEYFELTVNAIQKNILIETFGILDCEQCSNEIEFITSTQNLYGERVFVMNYPQKQNEESHPFNLTDFNYVNEREQFYNIVTDRQIIINGSKSEGLNELLSRELNSKSVFEITVMDSIAQGDLLLITIFLDIYEIDVIPLSDLILKVFILEHNIEYCKSDYTNEVKTYQNLFRASAQGNEEISLSSVESKGRRTYNLQKILDPRWNYGNLKIAAFIQNYQKGEILQTAISN